MTASIYSLAPLTINSTTIAVEMVGFSPGILETLSAHSGNPYASAAVIPGAAPRVRFRAFFQDIYALTGFTVLAATTFSLYLSKYAAVIKSASAVHAKLALAASATAVVTIQSVSTDQDGTAMAECEAVLLSSDGAVHPLALTTNNALPALTAAPVKHTLGPCVLDGTGIPAVTSLSLDLGHGLTTQRSDGDAYAKVAALITGEPRLSFGHADPIALLSTLGLLGTNPVTSLIAYLRRFDATTGVVGAANGVSFTIASGRVRPVDTDAPHGAVATSGIEVAGLSTSTTHPVVVSLVATVPASA